MLLQALTEMQLVLSECSVKQAAAQVGKLELELQLCWSCPWELA